MPPYYEEVGEATSLADLESGRSWATQLPIPCRINGTIVPLTSKVLAIQTFTDARVRTDGMAPLSRRIYDLTMTILSRFKQRCVGPIFVRRQRKFLSAL
jgi:hypothetical protein